MPRRIVRTERVDQPQSLVGVDWSNPIARGLQFLILPGHAADVVGKLPRGVRHSNLVSRGSSLVWPANAASWRLGFGQANLLGPLTNSSVMAVASTRSGAGGSDSPGSGQIGTGGNALYSERAASGNDIYKIGLIHDGSFFSVEFTYRNDAGSLIQHRVRDDNIANGQPFCAVATKQGQTMFVYSRYASNGGTFPSADYSFTNANVTNVGGDQADTLSDWNGPIDLVAGWNRTLSPAEVESIQSNPWQLFEPQRRSMSWAAAVTVYRPGSDVIVNGWTATGGSLASCIDEAVLDRGDFITSPNLTAPATLAWATPLPAGTWSLSVDCDRTGAMGQLRIVCLDGGGASVGASSWQALTGTATTYTLSVTTSATAPNFRIEVQA